MSLRGVILAVLVTALALVPAAAGGPIRTAIADLGELDGPEASLYLDRVRTTGSTVVRTQLTWSQVAPTRPSNATDPADPAYDWAFFDQRMRLMREKGLEPLVFIYFPPEWATVEERVTPNTAELGRFARAAAQRYSGQFQGLPRVRYWQVWNEPNASFYLAPQMKNGKPWSPDHYRKMVNAVSDSVHAVRGDNLVVAGGLSPFTRNFTNFKSIGPLRFMRELLCMTPGPRPRPKCAARTRFDVWSTHPYTSGGPTHQANLRDDVSLGDLPEMRRLLDAAVRYKRILSPKKVRFWVTEFSWDTAPPDPTAVPMWLHARWTSEALYRMWKVGIDLVTWLQLRDIPISRGFNQGGLYFAGETIADDRPKLSLQAWRFPFVAFRKGQRATIWGRTPTGRRAAVVIEQRVGRGPWRRIARTSAKSYGIFKGSVALRNTKGYLRARIGGDASVRFSLARVPDRFFNPFGDR